jgi:hypothetical protein
MPSFGLKQKLSVLGVAMVALGASTSSAAAANDVWLWSCHGPSGEALGDTGFSSNFAPYGTGCDGPAADLGLGGMRAQLDAASTTASVSFSIPTNTELSAVRIQRIATVPAGVKYDASVAATSLESSDGTNVAGAEKTFAVAPAVSSNSVRIQLSCTAACPAGPPSIDVGRVGMKVAETGSADSQKPSFAVGGWRSPAADELTLDVRANDSGLGLKSAQAYFEGGTVPAPKPFPSATNCHDLTPADATVDLPVDNSCPNVDNVELKVNTRELPDGAGKRLVVNVEDIAGNVTTQVLDTEILNNVNLGTNIQTLNIGTSNTVTPAANNPPAPNTGGVAGAQASQVCKTPRLSFSLSQKPLRISKGVPVLQSGKRYRFNGRLTCVINGKRRSAPKRARIDILNKIGKKTYTKAGTTVREGGKLTVILSYKTSRTLIFRFTSSDNKRSQVSIKLKVEKKKKSKR